MRERSFDEMIAYFNRRVADMDISQDCKMELLGMIAAIGYKHETSVPQWIPCSERLPEEDGDYWITVDPRYVPPQYKSTDIILWSNGKWMMADYFVIDGEGRKMPEYKAVEVDIPIIAWMPLPEPYRKGDD